MMKKKKMMTTASGQGVASTVCVCEVAELE